MLWGRALRSPYPHARIASIDTSQAEAAPGVHAVLTGDHPIVKGVRIGRRLYDVPVLAQGTALFIGDKIAAVAAETKDQADAALDLIEVEYEELPAVADVAPPAPMTLPLSILTSTPMRACPLRLRGGISTCSRTSSGRRATLTPVSRTRT